MKVMVVGARGFVGRQLVSALEGRGHRVFSGSRLPHEARRAHPMERWAMCGETGDAEVVVFATRTHWSVPCRSVRVVDALERPHIEPNTTVLRVGPVIGEGADAWTALRDLAMRAPLVLRPPWFERVIQPLWVGDLTAALVHAVENPSEGVFDLPGPEVLTTGELVTRVAHARRMRPRTLPLPVDAPELATLWLRMFTRSHGARAAHLVRLLSQAEPLAEPGYWALMEHERATVDQAIRRTLRYEQKPARIPERFLESVVRRAAGAGLKRTEPRVGS